MRERRLRAQNGAGAPSGTQTSFYPAAGTEITCSAIVPTETLLSSRAAQQAIASSSYTCFSSSDALSRSLAASESLGRVSRARLDGLNASKRATAFSIMG